MDFKSININDIPSWPRSFKILVIAVISFALFLLSFLIVIFPQISSLSSKKAEEVELKQKLMSLAFNVNIQKQQEAQVQELKKRIELYKEPLPTYERLGEILDELNKLATQTGIDLLFLKPESVKQEAFYAYVPISIHAKGDYFTIASFIDRIGQFNYYLYPSQISLAQAKSASKEPVIMENQLALEMTIDMYYLLTTPNTKAKNIGGGHS